MNEQQLKDWAYQVLMGESEEADRAVEEHRRYFSEVWERDHGAIGRLVRAHLVVEHFLTTYLAAANPSLGDLEAARLSFAQKLELALNPASVLLVIGPGIRALNKLRNQLVHRLECHMPEADLEPFRRFITIRNEGIGLPVPEGIELIEEFSKTACTFLAAARDSIERHGRGLGLLGLNEWWRERLSQITQESAS